MCSLVQWYSCVVLYNGIVEVQNRKGTEAGLVLVLIPDCGVGIVMGCCCADKTEPEEVRRKVKAMIVTELQEEESQYTCSSMLYMNITMNKYNISEIPEVGVISDHPALESVNKSTKKNEDFYDKG